MKEKFEIKNLLTEKHKLDRRYYLVQRTRQFISGIVIGSIAGALFGCYLSSGGSITIGSPEVLESKIEVKAVEVKAKEIPCDYDPITYLRCKGTQLGIKDTEITKIIATMKCESGLRPDALNKNSNGTFDVGIGQINDVHNKRISRQDRMDFIKNIDFIYKLYQEQGLRPWVCAKKLGFVK